MALLEEIGAGDSSCGILNWCGDSSCGLLNCVGNKRIFKDGELKCVDSFGVRSLEYARNGSRKYVVNRSTVRRRGGFGVRTVCFGPSPQCGNGCNRQRNNSRMCVAHVESGRVCMTA